ncbi:hypothetical protein BGW38_004101, partial [Lunasporangiospora selenospora]
MASRLLVPSLSAARTTSAAAPPSLSGARRLLSTTTCSPPNKFLPHSRGHTRLNQSSRPFSSAAAAKPAAPNSSKWSKTAIGGAVALVSSATLLNQFIKAPQMEGNPSTPSILMGGSVVQDLKDEHNRIGVEKKSTPDLLLSMFVYKMCTLSLLVEMAPKLISLAEMMHLSSPVYWIVRKTFFAQFCG